jgi:hypothetical protein
VKVRRVREDGQAPRLVVDVVKHGRTATAEIENSDSLGDAGLASAIQAVLDRAGLDARVEVRGGRIEVEVR